MENIYNILDLKNSILNVSVNRLIPFCDIIRHSNGTISLGYGIESELLKLLERRHNFRSNMIDGHEQWGNYVNGSWIGIIQHVIDGTSNFAVCCISQLVERMPFVDFTYFTYAEENVFISRSQGAFRNNWTLISPFFLNIWMAIFFSFLVVMLFSYFIKKYLFLENFNSIIIHLLGISINRATNLFWKQKPVSLRVLYSFWLLFCLILTNLYSSNLYSILTFPEQEHNIDTVDDLIDIATHDHHYLIFRKYSAFRTLMINSKPRDGLLFLVKQHLVRTQKNYIFTNESDMINMIESDQRNVYFGHKTAFQVRSELYSTKPLHISREVFGQDFLAIMLPKRSQMKKPFDALIIRVHEMGLTQKWLTNALVYLKSTYKIKHIKKSTQINQSSIYSFNLNDFNSIFFLWLFGMVISMGILICEIICKTVFCL